MGLVRTAGPEGRLGGLAEVSIHPWGRSLRRRLIDPDRFRYGPAHGPQWVIDRAKPSPVTDPGGGITFTTRADLQTKIDDPANPAGTKFVHAAGGTIDWDAKVNVSNRAPNIYFLGLAGSTATVIDAGARQIIGMDGSQTVGFSLHGGTWQNFGNNDLTATMPFIPRDNALAEDFVTQLNYRKGFESQGSFVTVRRFIARDNGQYGFTAVRSGPDVLDPTGCVFEYFELDNNNTRQLPPGGDAGGTKFSRIRNSDVRYWWGHDNYGFCIWPDYANTDSTPDFRVSEGVAENNMFSGIFFEGVSSGCNITRNYCKDNGFGDATHPPSDNAAQIIVRSSDGTINGSAGIDVSYNIVDRSVGATTAGHLKGIALQLWQDLYPHDTKKVSVHHNQIWIRENFRAVGGRAFTDIPTDTKLLWAEPTNSFDFNEYHVASLASTETPYMWDAGSGNGVAKTRAQWQAYGFDANSTWELI